MYKRQGPDTEARLVAALTSQLSDLEVVGSIVVLRTLAGGAQVVAAAVDGLALAQVAGSLAGDDTVFVLARSPGGAKAVERRPVSYTHLDVYKRQGHRPGL